MTKKLGISLIASTILMVSTANAACDGVNPGEITRFDGTGKTSVSYEKVEVTTMNVSAGKFAFTPRFSDPSTRTNPIFEYNFGGTDVNDTALQDSLSNTVVAEINSSFNGTSGAGVIAYVSDIPSVDNGVVTYGQLDSANVKSGTQYAIVTKDTNVSANIPLLIAKGDHASIPNIGVTATVYTGDTGECLSKANDTIFEEVKEYKAALVTPFDARISLCDSRKTFTSMNSACGADSNVTDTVAFSLARINVADYPFKLDSNASNVVIGTDVNVSSYIASITRNANSTLATIGAGQVNDTNLTVIVEDSSLDETTTSSLVLDVNVTGTDEIANTKFNWAFNLSGSEGTTVAANGLAGNPIFGSAGEWKPFGYYAQIPNVQNDAANAITTNIVIANQGTEPAEVYFTLTANGQTCAISNEASINPTNVPGKSTVSYNAATLFAACQDTLGADTTKVTLEIDIPTTPENIAVFGSWIRDLSTGKQFKDLPVYHTGTLVQ